MYDCLIRHFAVRRLCICKLKLADITYKFSRACIVQKHEITDRSYSGSYESITTTAIIFYFAETIISSSEIFPCKVIDAFFPSIYSNFPRIHNLPSYPRKRLYVS